MFYCVSGFAFRNCEYGFICPREIGVLQSMKCVGFFVRYFNRESLFNEKRLLLFRDL